MKGIHGIAAVLTCVACASTAAAQAPEYVRARPQALREQKAAAKAQAQVDAQAQRQAAAQARSRAARGGVRGGQAEASETFTRMVRLERGATFYLQNVSGDVTITGGSGSEGKIEVVKHVRAFTNGRAQLMLPQIRVDIAERGGNVEVRTMHPMGPRGPGEARVDYIVTLPANTNVMLRSTSGSLRVQNMSGDELNVDTLQGNVTVSDLQSRLLELHTVTGDMMLRDIAAQRAFVESTRGNLVYAGPLQRAGQYRFRTHSGDIRVIPAGTPGFDLEAMTNRGALQSNFVLKLLGERPGLRRANAQKILRGTVGNAAAMLNASSFSGNIEIVKPEGQ